MQRDFLAERGAAESSPWGKMAACPFYFRHTDSTLSTVAPNPQRFTQCYVTLPEFRRHLADLGVVVAAPIFRATRLMARAGESYWYTFYSGFSFLQLPTCAPTKERWLDRSLGLRWQLTTQVRQQTRPITGDLPIQRMFEGAEQGQLLTEWEQEARLVSISEGQATAFLLQWLLVRRLRAAIHTAQPGAIVDLTRRLRWEYAISGDPYWRLQGMAQRGFAPDLQDAFHYEEGGIFRTSSFEEDLQFLGLVSHGRATERLTLALDWLTARLGAGGDLERGVRAWLGPTAVKILESPRDDPLETLCWALLVAAAASAIEPAEPVTPSLRALRVPDPTAAYELLERFERDDSSPGGFRYVCRLVPELHLIVRAWWTKPLRWIFLPIAHEQAPEDPLRPRVHSALILMLQDHKNSAPYRSGARASVRDAVLANLSRALPLLLLATSIEEHHVREDLMLTREWWYAEANQAAGLRHLISEIQSEIQGKDAQFMRDLLDLLAAHYQIPPPPQDLSKFTRDYVPVPIRDAVQRGLRVFDAYFPKRRTCTVKPSFENLEPNVTVRVRALEASYSGDPSTAQRAEAALSRLVLDLLVQRVARESEIRLVIGPASRLPFSRAVPQATDIVLAAVLPHTFTKESEGCTPPDPLERWPWGRGFFSLFSLARALGATACEVANEADTGIIRIAFERGSGP
jgi:hypothetical protein